MGLDLGVAGLWTATAAVAWEDSGDTTKRGRYSELLLQLG